VDNRRQGHGDDRAVHRGQAFCSQGFSCHDMLPDSLRLSLEFRAGRMV
jgi:hypothetical protein